MCAVTVKALRIGIRVAGERRRGGGAGLVAGDRIELVRRQTCLRSFSSARTVVNGIHVSRTQARMTAAWSASIAVACYGQVFVPWNVLQSQPVFNRSEANYFGWHLTQAFQLIIDFGRPRILCAHHSKSKLNYRRAGSTITPGRHPKDTHEPLL